MTSRQLAMAALAIAALLACTSEARLLQEQPSSPQLYDVVVVGAGMAGITIARNLSDAGFKVVVLEGRERAGGRLNSTSIAGVEENKRVDLGAMWIHEAGPGNALWELVRKLGLPMSPRQDYTSMAFYTPEGQRHQRSDILPVYTSWYSQFQPALRSIRSGAEPDRAVGAVYADWLARNPQFSQSDVRMANIILHTNYQSLLNGNVSALSSARLGDAKSIPALDQMVLPGFQSVVEALKGGLDIRYNTVVTAVEQGPDSVTVTTADGTNFTGRYAVVTPSLGLLKARAAAGNITFTPPLPEAKAAAIRDMGFGVLDKALFVFDNNTVFWPKDTDFLLRETDLSGRWAIFLNYYKLNKWPALAAIHVADTARALESMTDAEVIGEGLEVLRTMFGAGNVPEPRQANVTRWAADAFSLGAYSYFAVGNPRNITDVLAEPTGRVLWAGEATSRKPATVLGAYLSGLREAERLRALLSGNVTTPAN